MTSLGILEKNKLFLETMNRIDEELQKSNIILMKQNNLKKLLPVHCNVMLAIKNLQEQSQNKHVIIIDIAKKLYKSKAAVGTVVSTLKKHQYLTLQSSMDDKRSKIIKFTQKGQKTVELIKRMWDSHNLMTLKTLSENEKNNLFKLLSKIEENIRIFNEYNKFLI